MKKLLCIHYRPPFKNGRNNSFGQYNYYKNFEKCFNVKGISFGFANETFDNFEIIPLRTKNFIKPLKLILAGKSPRLTHFESPQFRKRLKELLTEYNPDYIYVEHIFMMQYLLKIKTKAKVILFDDDSFLYSKKHQLEGGLFQKIRNIGLANYELKCLNRADHIITITEEEKVFINKLGFENTFCIPYGIDVNYFFCNWNRPKENSILFVGNFDHYPNREAVSFLVKEVFPNLENLNCKLRIVGRNIHRIKNMLPKEIEVYEDVPDVREFYWNSSLFVAPLFSGAGLRVKILEAAACGIPVVLTPLANLGIGFTDNETCFANNANEFSTQIAKIFNTSINIYKLNQFARKKIEEKFSILAMTKRIEKVTGEIINKNTNG